MVVDQFAHVKLEPCTSYFDACKITTEQCLAIVMKKDHTLSLEGIYAEKKIIKLIDALENKRQSQDQSSVEYQGW